MTFHILDPEVAGELGPQTVLDSTVHPPRVTRLHYIIDAWMGDDLVQSFPCYLITEDLRERLESLQVSGVRFATATVSISDEYHELKPDVKVPEFFWLQIHGTPGKDDLGLTADARLVVSQRVRSTMRLSHCGESRF